MKKETSIYLDLIRFSAASIVAIGHLSGKRFTGGFLWQASPFMGQAVVIFFVLSGYVIAYVTDKRETNASAYAISRAARMYSVALPALIVTFALDYLGHALNASLYSPAWGYHAEGKVWQFLSGLFFVHQLWFLEIPQGSDLPYWSLGYEVPYYIIFGLFFFAPGRWKWIAATIAAAIAGPRILLLAPVWLMGIGAYRLRNMRLGSNAVRTAIFVGSGVIFLCYTVWLHPYWKLDQLGHKWSDAPVVLQVYATGLLFALNVLAFDSLSTRMRPLVWLERPIRVLAGMTFTIYLFHLPVAQLLAAASPFPASSLPGRTLMVGGTALAIVAVAQITENRKNDWRRFFEFVLAAIQGTKREVRPPAIAPATAPTE